MQDFHEYYSGPRTAPYLTVFVGGNHEASNYMFELFYGGWVAPNIYYMGAANVLRVGPLRIAGMSGIWKGYDYKKPHFERLPYSQDDLKSIYHTRESDVRKLLCLRSQVDVGISHDWPRGVEWQGDHRRLFGEKRFLEDDAQNDRLGSVAARYVLDRLRPPYWFSAHLHVKFSACVQHDKNAAREEAEKTNNDVEATRDVDDDPATSAVNGNAADNADEIDLGMDDDEPDSNHTDGVPHGMNGAPEPVSEDKPERNGGSVVSEALRAQLPAAFTQSRPVAPSRLPFPEEITNKSTKFLALDKCLPNRSFLQLVSIVPTSQSSGATLRPVRLEYDPEWLAITRVFASELNVGDPNVSVPADKGDAHYRPLIEKELAWVSANVEHKGLLAVPTDFSTTASVYDAVRGMNDIRMPREFTNPQTSKFCEMLDIPNPFHISEAERDERMARGPRVNDGGARGGRGRGGGRGGFGRGRSRGRGRGH